MSFKAQKSTGGQSRNAQNLDKLVVSTIIDIHNKVKKMPADKRKEAKL